jgi:uncharacterized membrane protein YccC
MKQELYCENGKHKWTREAKRGRKPRHCPKHPDEQKPKVSSQETKIKALAKAREVKIKRAKQREAEEQENAVKHLEYLRERVQKAEQVEDKAHKRLLAKRTDKNLDEWLKLDGRLMAEVTALRAAETKVAA